LRKNESSQTHARDSGSGRSSPWIESWASVTAATTQRNSATCFLIDIPFERKRFVDCKGWASFRVPFRFAALLRRRTGEVGALPSDAYGCIPPLPSGSSTSYAEARDTKKVPEERSFGEAGTQSFPP
jgi:hypothetical protein